VYLQGNHAIAEMTAMRPICECLKIVGLCKRKISRRLRKNLHITISSLFTQNFIHHKTWQQLNRWGGKIISEIFHPMWSRHLVT